MTPTTGSSAEPSSTMGRDPSENPRSDQSVISSSPPVARNKQSFGSSDAGESSTSASQRHSLLSDGGGGNGINISPTTADISGRDGHGSHRSHRSRHSGGFLLSNPNFERPTHTPSTSTSSPPQRRPLSDYKGKSAPKSLEKNHKTRKLNRGLGFGSSPLAGHVSNTEAEHGTPGSAKLGGDAAEDHSDEPDHILGEKPPSAVLEVDAAQIVNLALNLSESRRNASRRIASVAYLPPVAAFTENIAGSSMRYHMQQQQQRRSSRNVSPKPDRGERAMGPNPRAPSGRLSTQLQPVFDMQPDGTYQYQFSASTIARADKAKKAIELMAQYRKLLDYVAPLKPATLERSTTTGLVPTNSSALSTYRTYSRNANSQLGRPYNPLQYIRNRKVRARNSMAIDGEEQGFGDLSNVSSWVEEISRTSPSHTGADCLALPLFSKTGETAILQASPQSALGRSNTSAKIRRPRIDWITSPADMLADVYWLEQNDNKKLVEDRHGRTIFPRDVELRKQISRSQKEPSIPSHSPEGERDEEKEDPSQAAGGKLPEFKSVKSDNEKFPDLGQSRARQKLRDVRDAAKIHHGHNGHSRDIRGFLRARSRSDSNSSNSETDRRSTRKRSGTGDSEDRGIDILEKQMEAMLAEDSKDHSWATTKQVEVGQIAKPVESQDIHLHEELEPLKKEQTNHNRSESIANRSNRNSYRNGSSGRASLEVPGSNPRGSLEDLDHTAPNSPERKAERASNSHIPSIAMDLSSPRRRQSSQPRAASDVETEARQDYDRRQDLGWTKGPDDNGLMLAQSSSKETVPDSSEVLKKRHRSASPGKRMIQRKTDDSFKSLKKVGSIRKARADDSSGIRGFLRSARNPVSRVGDIIWRKEPATGHGNTSSSLSTDESDSEARVPPLKANKEQKRESTGSVKFDDLDKVRPRKERPSYLNEMPVFTSPFENRGRHTENRNAESPVLRSHSTDAQTAREFRRRPARGRLLDPAPRIDVYPPLPSPDLDPLDVNRRQSSSSAQESRKGSFPGGVQEADSRLNAVLGYPGRRRNDGLPVTGLANLETGHDRRPSLRDKRQWSISDRAISAHRGPTTKRETARVQALLLSSGIKAKEISRRAAELKDLREEQHRSYVNIAELSQEEVAPVPKSQEHLLAARIISNDIQLSSKMWQSSADTFCDTSISYLISSIESLQSRLSENLTPMTRKAADDADEFSKDLVTSQTLKVQEINDKMEKMFRARRRRFRWLRRGGWVLVEWALVGVMWYVWFMVMMLRIVMGIGTGVVGSVRWLFFA